MKHLTTQDDTLEVRVPWSVSENSCPRCFCDEGSYVTAMLAATSMGNPIKFLS